MGLFSFLHDTLTNIPAHSIGAIAAYETLKIFDDIPILTTASPSATITTLFPRQPYALAAFGFLFSIPCFRVIVGQPQYAVSGRFVLLAYNLTCLFRFVIFLASGVGYYRLAHIQRSYNMRADDVSVWVIALHRALAVTIGVIWALIVARWWWPSEARRELTRGLSEYESQCFIYGGIPCDVDLCRFCLNMSWLYTSLVMTWPSKELKGAPEPAAVQDEIVDPEQQALLGTRITHAPSAEVRRFMEMLVFRNLLE